MPWPIRRNALASFQEHGTCARICIHYFLGQGLAGTSWPDEVDWVFDGEVREREGGGGLMACC